MRFNKLAPSLFPCSLGGGVAAPIDGEGGEEVYSAGISLRTRCAFAYKSPPFLKRGRALATEVPKESFEFKDTFGLPRRTVA